MKTLLRINDLHVSYGRIKALKGINLEVGEGEVVTIIGANGAGKTTLLKTISGLLRPVQGTLEFLGRDINKAKSHHLVKDGLIHVPEGRAILNRMSVYENLLMGGYYEKNHQNLARNIERMYEFFPILKEKQNQMAGTLSGGQQQMLAIARGLLAKPKLMMLDEPSLGLAPLIIKDIFRIIKELKNQGITVLLVEQNAKQALKVADRGYVFETGRVVCSDSATHLLESEVVIKAYLGESKAQVAAASNI
ncbi:MAG: ABC transporter ATP-binding protein [Thermincolia bacterium]